MIQCMQSTPMVFSNRLCLCVHNIGPHCILHAFYYIVPGMYQIAMLEK